MTRLLHGFHLVELQQAGGGAEYGRVAFPLVNRLPVHQNLAAGGAGRRQIHLGECGLRRFCVLHQREDGTDLQILLMKTDQNNNMKHPAGRLGSF